MIDFLRRNVDLKIAEQVSDDETEQDDTRHCHHHFLAYGGSPEAGRPVAAGIGCECAHDDLSSLEA